MPKVGKREQKILNKLARKKLSTIKEQIQSGDIVIPDKPIYGMIPKYETPEEMKTLIKEYIDDRIKENKPLTISGLAKKLQVDVQTVRNYENKDEFLSVMKNVKLDLLNSYETKMLTDPKSFNAIKYYLENNFSNIYSTKTTSDVNITGSISLVQLNREAEKIINATIVEGTIVE